MGQREALEKALKGAPPGDVERSLEETLATYIERFRLDVPQLDRAGISQLPSEEIDIDVSQDPMRAVFDRSRPHYLKGTAVRIAVPFTGEAELFKYGTSYYPNPIAASLESNRLILTHAALEPAKDAVKQDFDERLSRIDQVLGQARQTANGWNDEIARIARPLLEGRRAKLERDKGLRLDYPMAPAPVAAVSPAVIKTAAVPKRFDLFISHASEDKDSIARPLYKELTAMGLSVWFDEAVLKLGDSLRRKIDEGLAKCRYGVVILSPSFFKKEWPQKELDGLVARETASGEKAILPVWHAVDQVAVAAYSPTLADRVAAKSSEGVSAVAAKIAAALGEHA